MAGAAMAPALGTISEHFSSYSNLTVQLVVSLPALFIIVTNLFFPLFCKLMRTRTLAVVGLLLYVVSGAGAFFVEDIVLVLVLRALLGVSVGMIMPLSTGLLAYYYPPEQQAHLMGLSAFMSQMGGVVATLLSGFLCGIAWNYAFLVYLLGALALLLVLLYLPNEKLIVGEKTLENSPDYYDSECGVTKARKKPGHPLASLARFSPSVLSMFFVMLLFFIFPTNFAITSLVNENLTVNTITLIMVGLDVVASIFGLVFGMMMKVMRNKIKYIAPVGFMLGYACYACGTSLALLIVGSVIIGLANGVGIPYINTIASIKGGKTAATTVMPLVSAAMFLGQFVSPLLVSPLSDFIFPENPLGAYWIGVGLAAIFLVITFVTRRYQSLPKRV